MWYIQRSSVGYYTATYGGVSGDIPAPADFDGDGKADLAVWRPSNNTFYSKNSSDNGFQTVVFSQSGNIPVSADYDGDRKADYALYTIRRPVTGISDKALPVPFPQLFGANQEILKCITIITVMEELTTRFGDRRMAPGT